MHLLNKKKIFHFSQGDGCCGDLLAPLTIKSILVFMKSDPHFCPISTKLRSSRNIFAKNSNENYMEISPMKTTLIHADRQTDKYENNWRVCDYSNAHNITCDRREGTITTQRFRYSKSMGSISKV